MERNDRLSKDAEVVKKFFEAGEELLKAELSTSNKARFNRVASLAVELDSVSRMFNMRVKDEMQQAYPGQIRALRGPGQYDADYDGEVGERWAAVINEPHAPHARPDPMRELALAAQRFLHLQLMRDARERVILVQQQLDTLAINPDKDNPEERSKREEAVNSALRYLKEVEENADRDLVHSQLLRGHQAGGNGREVVPPHRGEHHQSGEGGDCRGGGVREEEEVGADGERHPHGGNDGNLRADQEGAGEAHQGNEGGQGDRLGGHDLGRQDAGDQGDVVRADLQRAFGEERSVFAFEGGGSRIVGRRVGEGGAHSGSGGVGSEASSGVSGAGLPLSGTEG